MDPTFLSLYREYASAVRALENAMQQRRRARSALEAKPDLRTARRPVGAPAAFHIPQAVAPQPVRAAAQQTMEIDMGPILGRVRLRSSASPVFEEHDPAASFDVDRLYDQTSLALYWNAKVQYLRAKQAFFEYARKSLIAEHKAKAQRLLQDAADSQLLGSDDVADSSWKQAQGVIESLLAEAWKLYQSAPTPKNEEMKKLFVSAFALAQWVGIEDTAIYRQAYPDLAALTGFTATSEPLLSKLVTEVRQQSVKALADYRSAPEPKSAVVQKTFVLATAEAQVALPPDDLLLQEMNSEISRLLERRGSVLSR